MSVFPNVRISSVTSGRAVCEKITPLLRHTLPESRTQKEVERFCFSVFEVTFSSQQEFAGVTEHCDENVCSSVSVNDYADAGSEVWNRDLFFSGP